MGTNDLLDENDPRRYLVTLGELKQKWADLPDDLVVVQSSDGEGNGMSPFADFSVVRYRPESTWSGEIMDPESTDVDGSPYYSAETLNEGIPCLVLWPVN
jgi:hypothetical protein